MTDETDGPDPNSIRRHQRKMLTEYEYRRKYRRFDFYRPNDRQLAFHNLQATECMLRAGNQLGKTHAAAAQMTMDALALYPEWYDGREFNVPPAIERPFDFLGWAACDTSATTRAGVQTKLLGDVMQDGGLGTGLIPLDSIVGKPAMARGISDFIDSVTLRRDNGGTAVIRFKTYEMGRKAFQGEPCDEVWIDEDPGGKTEEDVYGECLARLTTTNGKIIVSMTPLLGLSPLRKRFKERTPGTAEVVMTIDDCLVSKGGHVADEMLAAIVARTKEHQRATRLYGADMQGEGAVFETPSDLVKHTRDPAAFPVYWRWMWGVDFRHSGSLTGGHPFASVLGVHDLDNDIIYIVAANRLFGQAPSHVAAMKAHPMWDAPVAWPHDGGRAASLMSGETVAAVYRKLGLAMRPTHAQFPDGSFKFENGIDEMDRRFATGRLKVAAHLSEWFDEYMGYHRKDGLVVKVDDDLMSATRQLVMDIRFAKRPVDFRTASERRRLGGVAVQGNLARDVDFDLS